MQIMDDPSAKEVAKAAAHFTNILQEAPKRLSLCGPVDAMAGFRAELDAALHHYMKEHATYHLRREAMLARQLGSSDDSNNHKQPRLEAEMERCYGKELLDWVSRVSAHSDDEKHVVGRARLWHAALLDRNFEMVYKDANNNVVMRRGSASSPIKVECTCCTLSKHITSSQQREAVLHL